MRFGDVRFLGKGADGPERVGIEVKKIGDFLSSIYTGRLAEIQLPGLIATYTRPYLLIVGRALNEGGDLAIGHKWGSWKPKGRPTRYKAYRHMISSIQEQTPVMVDFADDLESAADWIDAKYSWWQKPWDAHDTLKSVKYGGGDRVRLQLARPSLVRLWASDLPDIGFEKSAHVSAAFARPLDLALADEKAWARITGIGKVIAKRVYEAIRTRA